jgi:hypothetical protein
VAQRAETAIAFGDLGNLYVLPEYMTDLWASCLWSLPSVIAAWRVLCGGEGYEPDTGCGPASERCTPAASAGSRSPACQVGAQ